MQFEQDTINWDRQVSRAWVRVFLQDMPIVRDLKVFKVEGFGLGMWTELEEDVGATGVTMKQRGGEFVRHVGWEGGWDQESWERYLKPW
jgi:hypothetical protein